MKFSNLVVYLFAITASLVSAQQTVQSSTGSNAVISQYGSTFKNAGGSVLHDKVNGKKIEIKHPAKTHEEAVDFTLKQLTNPEYKVIDDLDEISAIGHRLLNGGEKIKESTIIDDYVV